jgi:hypothetical protein
MKKKYSILFVTISIVLFNVAHLVAETVDHSVFNRLLKSYVSNGVVDYNGLSSEKDALERYLDVLDKADPSALNEKEEFAFYTNAYNAWTIKLILDNYPGVKSIKELGTWIKTPWQVKFCKVGGKVLTLDEIEHEILRKKFKDPRVHFAVNCASIGCPPVRNEAFTGNMLETQLNDNTANYVNDISKNYFKGNTLYVSKIFKWFSEDFNDGPAAFLLKYAKGDFKDELEKKKNVLKIKYYKYDWMLNGS